MELYIPSFLLWLLCISSIPCIEAAGKVQVSLGLLETWYDPRTAVNGVSPPHPFLWISGSSLLRFDLRVGRDGRRAWRIIDLAGVLSEDEVSGALRNPKLLPMGSNNRDYSVQDLIEEVSEAWGKDYWYRIGKKYRSWTGRGKINTEWQLFWKLVPTILWAPPVRDGYAGRATLAGLVEGAQMSALATPSDESEPIDTIEVIRRWDTETIQYEIYSVLAPGQPSRVVYGDSETNDAGESLRKMAGLVPTTA
ncbi:MAG: hypothetical protein M1833_002532 [Piccolia ochrophora]|nr:MAG: hypothetical protein M1833_002532 [Piccolia ochrophora]